MANGFSRVERVLIALAALAIIGAVVGHASSQHDKSNSCSNWQVQVAAHEAAPDTQPDPGPNPC